MVTGYVLSSNATTASPQTMTPHKQAVTKDLFKISGNLHLTVLQ
ncbi:Uncharacterised protein [Plesiomonas shigelloides]|nr:Uncharacterised protein [Plesiomonas shigelloides]SPZ44433.1 Uncharacterised protein [Plesiomonas shigelloides]